MFSVVACFAPLSSEDFVRIFAEKDPKAPVLRASTGVEDFPALSPARLKAVKRYSTEYGLDYRLILAIMKQESQFNEHARSGRGARGYMQIMPVTNSQLRDELDLPDPEVPVQNIRTGIYYFSKLYSLFPGMSETDRLSFALAAYNAGPARIYDAQVLAAYIGEDAKSWTSVESILPLLSKRYYSLHQTVWSDGHPPTGCFGEFQQTIGYVHRVLKAYQEYQAAM
jgi:membrane-bound lytic murein transglycosylase F